VLPASNRRKRIDGVLNRNVLDPGPTSAVWLVQRKHEQSPMAKAFTELLTRNLG
ncbi:LysR family transcriptional regulator, partial [Pseudomonas syringae pv. tagetis]